ncbi:MAG: MFS transporter [Clostridia bacterium]|nr:MFS transporter [Clostridia bacterium]
MKLTAKHTVRAGYLGYITQAVTINFAPLLFVTFEKEFDISLGLISLLIAVSFLTQLTADGLEAKFAKYLNVRATVVFAHLCAAAGMIGYAVLPSLLPSPFWGLLISTVIAATGGGIIEVLISPIVEACPTGHKSAVMSMLHSFYSWGLAAVVLLSTLFFWSVGVEHWRILACLWALIPLCGAILFCFVPLYEPKEAPKAPREEGQRPRSGLTSPLFLMFLLMMFCSGAAEMAMCQWASVFAEEGLRVSKTMGDLLGPCAFAILMGSARVAYAKWGYRANLSRIIALSSALSVLAYLLAALSGHPILSLVGCGLCGLSVGIMWPGTYSLSARLLTNGSVRMFALLAMACDLGCMVGPTVTGWIADRTGGSFTEHFIVAALFPLALFVLCLFAIPGEGLRNKRALPPNT